METITGIIESRHQSGLLRILCLVILIHFIHLGNAASHDSIPVKYAVQAAQYCQVGQYDKALAAIELATADNNEKDELYTWYVKGFVHKEIYKHRESQNIKSPQRELAVEAFLKSKQLAGEQPDIYNNNSALKYLSSTYYNDAMMSASNFSLDNELEADAIMNKYDSLRMAIGQEGLGKGDFFKQKAMRYYHLWKNDPCDISLNEKAFAAYELAIDHHLIDCDTYYNAALVKYNLAKAMHDSDVTSCYKGQDFSNTLQASVHLLEASFERCADHNATIKALQNSYIMLGDEKKAQYYQALLKP